MKKISGLILFAILAVVAVGYTQVIGCVTMRGFLDKGYETPMVALYEQTSDGTYKRLLCQAIAFENGSSDNVYRFITAAHCVAKDDVFHERVIVNEKRYFVAFDDEKKTTYFAVKVVAAGYQKRGDNFAVLEVRLDKSIKTESDIAKTPAFKKFWAEVKDGKYKWFSAE